MIYELLKNINTIIGKARISNSEEIINNSLKAINALISLKNINNTQVNQINADDTQINIDSTKQLNINTNNTKIKQLNSAQTINKSTLAKVPDWLKKSKCVINPLSTDKESFQYSVTLSRYKK